MRLNSTYALFNVGGAKYLLPYGQGIFDMKRGVKLNGTSVVIWEAIVRGLSGEALVEHMAEYYEAKENEMDRIREDIENFIIQLRSMDIIIEDEIGVRVMNTPRHYLMLGPLCIEIFCMNEFMSPRFEPFTIERPITVDYNINAVMGAGSPHVFGEAIIRSSELNVYDSQEFYTLEFPAFSQISEVRIYKTADRSDLYFNGYDTMKVQDEIFEALRVIYLYTASRKGLFAIHSSSILYNDRAYLFSGSAGSGKTAITQAFNEAFDTPLLHDDVNLMGFEGDTPVLYSLPWSSESASVDTNSYTLGGIVLLKPTEGNFKCDELFLDIKSLLVVNRLISPTWTKKMLDRALEFTNRITYSIPVLKLESDASVEAARYVKNYIDSL